MNILKFFKGILGITGLEDRLAISERDLKEAKLLAASFAAERDEAWLKLGYMQRNFTNLTTQLNTVIDCLVTCRKLSSEDKEAIKTLSDLTNYLNQRLQTITGNSLYKKPKPALLQQVPPAMVMLGQMFVQSRKFGGRFLTYPSHPSIFMPGPVFEEVLTKADCNRMRDDISEVEVCKRIANVFQVSLTYMTDEEQWGVPDNWFAAALVRLLGYEDCESWAKAICSGIDYYQLKFGAFKTLSVMYAGGHITLGGTPYGHGFVGLISDTSTDLKDSFIIEATDNWASSPMPISTAKAMYDMAWGLIGWVREEYADGTYTINGSDRWWETPGVDAMRITGGLANFVKRLAGADEGKLLAEQKREALRKFSEERRKQEEV